MKRSERRHVAKVARTGHDIKRAAAQDREAMRNRPHDFDPGDLGLCAYCAAGEVYWVHVAGWPA